MITWPLDRPTLLLSSYRCGSAALCSHIAAVTGHANFYEIWHRRFPTRNHTWREHHTQGHMWVGKVMPDQIRNNRSEVETVINNSMVVSLRRHDVRAQIASLYISRCTHHWHTRADSGPSHEYKVGVYQQHLTAARDIILYNNSQLEHKWSQLADHHMWYEDLGNICCEFRPGHRPTDYEHILAAIDELDMCD